MDAYRATVILHVLFGIVLVGQALFWFVMNVSLGRSFAAARAQELLRVTQSARWPHVAVPYKFRLPLPWVGWANVAVLLASGALLVHFRESAPGSIFFKAKLAAIAALVLMQLLIQLRPRPVLINLNLLLALAIMVFAGLSIR